MSDYAENAVTLWQARLLRAGQCFGNWGWHSAARRALASATRHGSRFARCAMPAVDPGPDGSRGSPWEISKRTSIETSPAVKVDRDRRSGALPATRARSSLRHGRPPHADNEIAELRRYSATGGFLLLDTTARPAEARRSIAAIVAADRRRRAARALRSGTTCFKSFYLSRRGPRAAWRRPPIWKGSSWPGARGPVLGKRPWRSARSPGLVGTWEYEVTLRRRA